MVNQLYDGNPPERPRTKISQFARSDFLNPTSKVRVELFPVSIYVFNHSNPKIDSEIESIPLDDPDILSHVSEGASQGIIQGSHQGMNSLQLFRKYELPELVDWIYTCCDIIGEPSVLIHQSWVNASTGDSFQIAHTHAHSRMSGVYYHNTIPDQHGGIVFNNPNPYSKMCLWGTEEGRHFPATPRTLVLFPSWLEHKTVKSRINTPRISIAFNAR